MKKLFTDETFIIVYSFLVKIVIINLLLIPLELSNYCSFICSFFLAVLFTKMEVDKQDLENKIFELKQLIEDKKL